MKEVHQMLKLEKHPKALVLLSGGLDSTLATKLVIDQGVEVEAVSFITPFSSYGEKFVDRFCKTLGIKVHKVFLREEFLSLVANPAHGHGSQMNPCIDCRILMLKKAWELAEKIGASFLVTGEVLNERPFSQRKDALFLIEKEAGLAGKILRPLSAKLLPETEPEKMGLIQREKLLDIEGRRRLRQMELANTLRVGVYPNPSGGCLLTEIRFAERLKEHLQHEKKLTLMDAELLKVGRHFRINEVKVIVGRNELENQDLRSIVEKHGLASMEVLDYMGPLTVLVGKRDSESIEKAAAITARYSDAPKNDKVKVRYTDKNGERILKVKPIEKDQAKIFQI